MKKLYIFSFYRFSFYLIFLMALLLAVLMAGNARAQGIYFSQNNLTPLVYNPALGAMSDHASLMLNYRNQQSASQLNIHSLSFNGSMPLYRQQKSKRLGAVGLGMLSDKAEDFNSLLNQQLMASFALNLPLFHDLQLALGTQLAYGQQRLGFEQVTTGSQWVNNRGFDPSVGTGENFLRQQHHYWSTGAGMVLYREQPEGGIRYQAGAAIYHFNRPVSSFLDQAMALPISYRAHAAMEMPVSADFSLLPELQWQQQAGMQLWSLGSVLRYKFKNDNPFDPLQSGSLDFIARANISEALVFGLQLQQPGYVIGFSYDWGFSSSRFNGPGYHASEFGIALRKPIGGRKNRNLVPASSIGEIRQFYNPDQQPGSPDQQQQQQQGSPGSQGGSQQDGRGGSTGTGSTGGGSTAGGGNAAAAGNGSDAATGATATGAAAGANGTAAEYQGQGVQFELKKDFKFAFNKADLNPEAMAYLDELLELLQNNGHLKLRVVGHTDDVGTRKANKLVSEMRAGAVADYLMAQGLDAGRVRAEGKGDSEPLLPNSSEENRAKNRRVEFILYTR